MKIAVWKTGHQIADTVAETLAEGFDADIYKTDELFKSFPQGYDAHIAYGILRLADEVFRQADKEKTPWFNIDRGYLNPSHFDGYYRISYRGTQAKWHEGIPRKPWRGHLEPWRGIDHNKPVLICPPTGPVCEFFNVNHRTWLLDTLIKNAGNGVSGNHKSIIREKGDQSPIIFQDYSYVITFNSSVGWHALQHGIPVISDPEHSIIGSYCKARGIHYLTDKLSNLPDTRLELFEAMNAHQFTLDEIKQGKAWGLINHYLTSSSAGMAEKPHPPMSALIR